MWETQERPPSLLRLASRERALLGELGCAEANREIGVPVEFRNGKTRENEFQLSADNEGVSPHLSRLGRRAMKFV